MAEQVKSRQRVLDHGEAFTNERGVSAILDVVRRETERIDSRFLEIKNPHLTQINDCPFRGVA